MLPPHKNHDDTPALESGTDSSLARSDLASGGAAAIAKRVAELKAKQPARQKPGNRLYTKATPSKPEKQGAKENPQMLLDLGTPWPSTMHATANALVRSSLFAVNDDRQYHPADWAEIPTVGGIKLWIKGETFNQRDLSTFETVLHLLRDTHFGDKVLFTGEDLLGEMRRNRGGHERATLRAELERLRTTAVKIQFDTTDPKIMAMVKAIGFDVKEAKDNEFIGNMLSNYQRVGDKYQVAIDPQILKLFLHGYTLVDRETLFKIGDRTLASWLYRFYSTHADPYKYKAVTIMKLCGSKAKRLPDFRRSVRQALNFLVDINAFKTAKLEDDTDTLNVKPQLSESQQRYLTRNPAVLVDMRDSTHTEAAPTTGVTGKPRRPRALKKPIE